MNSHDETYDHVKAELKPILNTIGVLLLLVGAVLTFVATPVGALLLGLGLAAITR